MIEQVSHQLTPVFFRPVFAFAATAGMQCQAVFTLAQAWQLKARHRIAFEYCQLLQRLEEHVAGVDRLGLVGAMLRGDELVGAARLDVGFENLVGIEQVRNDDGELPEELAPLQVERTAPGKKHR